MMSLPYADDSLGSVDIGEIELRFLNTDAGGAHYQGRGHYEEYHSPFYGALRRALDPAICIDIGANYGFTGLLMRRAFPDSRLILVEPVPALEAFVRHNFEANNAKFDEFISAIVSSEPGRSSFGVNKRSSQDSRVVPKPGWEVIETDVHTLDDLLAPTRDDEGVYVKIDTQGWEEHVFAGGEAFLARHGRWFIKTEFAPMWLESQGSDPVALLRYLINRYSVHESPARHRWNSTSLEEIIGRPLDPGCEAAFVDYTRNLTRNDRGWVDLYVLPPGERRQYPLTSG